MIDLQAVKRRFGIIGNSKLLERTLMRALKVAPTDLSVLITGESGVGKEVIPKIIHNFSSRKHGPFIAVNCGAIPEGTIDSELFGHEKGSFTGAYESRKGYFEEANEGTIFLDEVADLPIETQIRLLRILETGEYLRVGSSKVRKTNVRIIAATNVDLIKRISLGRFREDLYYRLSTVPINIPPLRERKEDIHLLFKKFTLDFAEKYKVPQIKLNDSAIELLSNYYWPGNVRQLKNVAEQISILESNREIDENTLKKYLSSDAINTLPVVYKKNEQDNFFTERELIYKFLFDMKKDIIELKKLFLEIVKNKDAFSEDYEKKHIGILKKYSDEIHKDNESEKEESYNLPLLIKTDTQQNKEQDDTKIIEEETLSLSEVEKKLIKKALEKYKGRKNKAAKELGISERTLYRKIKQYNIE